MIDGGVLYLAAAAFFVVAFTYATVGLGGASTYTALLVLAGFSHGVVPTLTLSMNLLVTSSSVYNYVRQRHVRWRLLAPFVLTSMPAAYLGGMLVLPKTVFEVLLLLSLVFVAVRIYFFDRISLQLVLTSGQQFAVSLVAGAVLGLVAGIVGIGGGIYLVPLILVLGLGTAKEAAACGAIFVWLNSMSGLVARLQFQWLDLTAYLPLLVAVLAGGVLGSYFGAARFATRTLEKILGVIILVAIGLLLLKLLGMR